MPGIKARVLRLAGSIRDSYFRRKHRRLIRQIREMGLFDETFYLETNPDVAKSWADPVVHFLLAGADEGRMPCPLFDPAHYRRLYPDVALSRRNPLLHYLEYGGREGRSPHPLFDTEYYREQCPDVVKSGINPLSHYLIHGAREGRDPNPLFDTKFYRRENPEIGEAVNPVGHYCRFGTLRRPNRLFDGEWYLGQYPDVKASGTNPLVHFVQTGAHEGRQPSPLFDPAFYLREYPEAGASRMTPLAYYLTQGVRKGHAVNSGRVPVHVEQTPSPAGPPEAEPVKLLQYCPRISLLVPVYNQTAQLLERLIASVKAQVYTEWELCLVDDGSSKPETVETLRRHLDPQAGKITICLLGRNLGIAGATNAALYLSSGEFVALLDHDDELAPDALFEIAKALNETPDLDAIYSDEDKVSPEGWLDHPFHKPDWSPELFRQVMYVGHLLCVRRSLAIELRGMDAKFNGVQDYEFMLRLSERTERIHHIPKVLYHWRSIPGSIASGPNEKRGIAQLQAAAVSAHLDRCRIPARAECHPSLPHRVVLLPLPRKEQPKVSIVIPTRDQPEVLEACLRSIFEKSTYPNFEVIAVDNGSTDARAVALFQRYPVSKVLLEGKFNYSRANNIAAKKATGRFLVLLNNDTEVISGDWLEELLFYADCPDVGAVSPLLLYPDRSVQHAGVVLGMRGTADHIMRGFPADCDGYFGSLSCTREVSAVTGACMALRTETFLKLGGFREEFRTIYQDVDLCLRLRQQGMRILYTPRAKLYHHESRSRGKTYDDLDRALLLDLWGGVIAEGDPYFNDNLDTATISPKLQVRASR